MSLEVFFTFLLFYFIVFAFTYMCINYLGHLSSPPWSFLMLCFFLEWQIGLSRWNLQNLTSDQTFNIEVVSTGQLKKQ
jgi:hypothetical protein